MWSECLQNIEEQLLGPIAVLSDSHYKAKALLQRKSSRFLKFFYRVTENYLPCNWIVYIWLVNWKFLLHLYKMGGLEKKNKTHKKRLQTKHFSPHSNGHLYCLCPYIIAVLRHCLDCTKLHNDATITVSEIICSNPLVFTQYCNWLLC